VFIIALMNFPETSCHSIVFWMLCWLL